MQCRDGHCMSFFPQFWDAYGNKRNRKNAEAKFPKAVRTVAKSQNLNQDRAVKFLIERAATYRSWCVTTGVFQKNAPTWLLGENWDDELAGSDTGCSNGVVHSDAASEWTKLQAALKQYNWPEHRHKLQDAVSRRAIEAAAATSWGDVQNPDDGTFSTFQRHFAGSAT